MSLVAPMLGVVVAAIGGILLVNHAERHRSASGGGFLLGIGLTVAWLLVPALTNRDPAVTSSPSTVPVLIAGGCVAVVGFALVVIAVGRFAGITGIHNVLDGARCGT